MTQEMHVSGWGEDSYLRLLSRAVRRRKPKAIGLVSAFVSVPGIEQLVRLAEAAGVTQCRLVAGLDNAITHPKALEFAIERGWQVRVWTSQTGQGIFHPKLLVAGDSFARKGDVRGLNLTYVGSSNLTIGGLKRNVECGILAEGEGCVATAGDTFSTFWTKAQPATPKELRNYSAHFAEQVRRRSPKVLAELGVTDGERQHAGLPRLHSAPVPRIPAVSSEFATGVWVGLESFTGGYRFQVEFPRLAGEVLGRLASLPTGSAGDLDVYCAADGATRVMRYRFYEDNGMFRLNVPNDVPLVDWVRANRSGIAKVEKGPSGGAPLRLSVLQPSEQLDAIVGRSMAIGSWGRTTTRLYGWY